MPRHEPNNSHQQRAYWCEDALRHIMEASGLFSCIADSIEEAGQKSAAEPWYVLVKAVAHLEKEAKQLVR